MKNLLLIITLSIFVNTIKAQVPQSFKYQGVVRDAQNQLLTSKAIQVRIQIVQDYPNGSVHYIERHPVTTSDYGVFSLNIFDGISEFGTPGIIDWAAGPYHLLVEVDLDGGFNFEFMGASEMLSVPYALYGEDDDANPSNELQDLEYLGIDTSNLEHILKLTQSNRIVRIPINRGVVDADPNPVNEIQTLTKAGANITLNRAGGVVVLLDDDPKNELQKMAKAGNDIVLDKNGGKITLKDDDAKNELQKITKKGDEIELSKEGGKITLKDDDAKNELQKITKKDNVIELDKEGGKIALNDDDPTNEIQKISLQDGTISISQNGGSIELKDTDETNELQNLSAVERTDIVTQNIVTEIKLTDKKGNVQSVIIDDTDFTNELQRPILTLREGANGIEGDLNLDKIPGTIPVRLPDLDPTNELQELSLQGTQLRLSSGGSVDLKDIGGGSSSPWERINNNQIRFNGTGVIRELEIPSSEIPVNNFAPVQMKETSNALGGEVIIRGFGKRVNFWSSNIRLGASSRSPGHGKIDVVDPHEREVVSIYSESMNFDNEGRGVVEADQFKAREGILMRSSNGKCWMVTVDNGGNLKSNQLEGCNFNE